MMRFPASIATAVATAALVTGCDSTPTAPSTRTTAGYPTQMEIRGPAAVSPGETVQFTAVAHFSNGTTQDVTSAVRWRSSRPEVLSLAAAGAATGGEPGEATVHAADARTASRLVMVLPAGSYRLIGTVQEAGDTAIPVIGATVTAQSDGRSALVTRTGGDGRYRLYGVSGPTAITVTRDGYATRTERLVIADHHAHDVEMALLQPRADFSGTYTMTLNVDVDSCASPVPSAVETRIYTATLTQQGPNLRATLTNASFAISPRGSGNSFLGRVEPTHVSFTLRDNGHIYYYYAAPHPDVIERLDESAHLIVTGNATLTGSPVRLSGALSGEVALLRHDPRQIVACRSPHHRLTLSR